VDVVGTTEERDGGKPRQLRVERTDQRILAIQFTDVELRAGRAARDTEHAVIPRDRGDRRIGLRCVEPRADEYQLPGLRQATATQRLGDTENDIAASRITHQRDVLRAVASHQVGGDVGGDRHGLARRAVRGQRVDRHGDLGGAVVGELGDQRPVHREDFADERATMDIEHLGGGFRGVARDDPVARPAVSGVH
jgi:hypothetical protein